MSSPADPSSSSFVLSTRILAGSLLAALVMMGVAVLAVLGGDLTTPPMAVAAAQVAAGVVLHLVLETIGYRTEPLPPSLPQEEAHATARTRWQSGMILRFALAESVAIASLAGAFVVSEGGPLTYLVGALVSLALMAVHVWPGPRPVGKVADALERDGSSSGLREAFGVA